MTICKPRSVTGVVHDNWWMQPFGERLMKHSTMEGWSVTTWILCSVTLWSTVEEHEVICLLLECTRKHTVPPRSRYFSPTKVELASVLVQGWTCNDRKYSSLLKWQWLSMKAQGLFCDKSSRHQQKGVCFVLYPVCSRKAPLPCLP